jgi:hypothetical protein
MSDRTYTRFTIPWSDLSEASAQRICATCGLPQDQWRQLLTAEAVDEEAAGHDSVAIRTVEGVSCLVVEDSDDNYGGSATEQALIAARIPFILVHGAGDEYGPASTVFDGTTSETIRLDHDLEPVVAAGLLHGRVCADPHELADLARYLGMCDAILHSRS